MKTLSTLLFILLISCQTNTKPKEDSFKKLKNTETSNKVSELKVAVRFPLAVEFSDTLKSDSIFLTLEDERLVISRNGKVLKDGRIYFDIKPIDQIKSLFILPSGGDIIVFYVSTDGNGGASFAKRITPSMNKVKWEVPISAFNLASPAIVGDYAYLSTLGFIGKLDLNKGKYIWEYKDTNMKYYKLYPPKFLKDSLVLFSIWPSNAEYVLIDDAHGKIVKTYIK